MVELECVREVWMMRCGMWKREKEEGEEREWIML